jgi:hypothetical protein
MKARVKMSNRYVRAHITFEFDKAFVEDGMDREMTDKEFADYARETFIEDIYNFVKYNELQNAVKVEFVDPK